MFKKIISMVMVLVVMCGFTATANAAYDSEEKSSVIGIEIKTIDEDEYWIVLSDENYDEFDDDCVLSIYDHYPTEEEINTIWACVVLYEVELMLNELGF